MQPFQIPSPPTPADRPHAPRPEAGPCPDAELRRAISQLRQTLDRLPE